MDEGSFRVINNQPLNPSEEKEIVCRTDYLTPLTVDPPIQSCCCSLMEWLKRYCLTYLHCGFDPLLHLQTQTNYYDGILRRSFNVDCTDCNVHVWLSYTDCGCVESAARLRCDSNPVTQTNLGLTNLYSLLFLLWMDRTCGLTTHRYDFCTWTFVLNERTYRGVYIGSTLVAYHFLSRDFVLAFSNKKPMFTFLKFFARL